MGACTLTMAQVYETASLGTLVLLTGPAQRFKVIPATGELREALQDCRSRCDRGDAHLADVDLHETPVDTPPEAVSFSAILGGYP